MLWKIFTILATFAAVLMFILMLALIVEAVLLVRATGTDTRQL